MKQTARENIKIKGHVGTWYVIKDYEHWGKFFHLLEHETYGEDVGHLWVDEEHNIILDESFNGLVDLLEWIEEEEAKEDNVVITANCPIWVSAE